MYDNGRKKAEDTVMLAVNDCSAKQEMAKPIETPKETPKSPQGNVELITPASPVAQQQPEAPAETTATQEGVVLGTNAFVIGIIVAIVMAVIVELVLVVTLFKRRS